MLQLPRVWAQGSRVPKRPRVERHAQVPKRRRQGPLCACCGARGRLALTGHAQAEGLACPAQVACRGRLILGCRAASRPPRRLGGQRKRHRRLWAGRHSAALPCLGGVGRSALFGSAWKSEVDAMSAAKRRCEHRYGWTRHARARVSAGARARAGARRPGCMGVAGPTHRRCGGAHPGAPAP